MYRKKSHWQRSESQVQTVTDEQDILLPDPLLEFSEHQPVMPVVVLRSDQLGSGDKQLGRELVRELLQALLAHPEPPDLILFYHRAVCLLLDDSPVLEELQALLNKGTRLLACRMSLEKLADHPPVLGHPASFAELVDQMREAEKVLWF